MTRAQLMKVLDAALEGLPEDANFTLGEYPGEINSAWQLKPHLTCGRTDSFMGYVCCAPPGHKGACYSNNKCVNFTPRYDDGPIEGVYKLEGEYYVRPRATKETAAEGSGNTPEAG